MYRRWCVVDQGKKGENMSFMHAPFFSELWGSNRFYSSGVREKPRATISSTVRCRASMF